MSTRATIRHWSARSTPWSWALAAAAAAGVPAIAFADAHADHAPDVSDRASATRPAADALQRCTQWLEQHGAQLGAVAIQPSTSDSDGGFGLFATKGLRQRLKYKWLGNRLGAAASGQRVVVAAEIPLQLAVTAANALSDPDLGPALSELMELGLLDERTCVMVALLVDRMRGETSPRAAWLATLPQRFSTPLWFTEQQLLELRGTALGRAAALYKLRLHSTWQRLQPEVAAMLQRVGVEAAPTFDDFLWAYSVFWSRGQSLPMALPAEAAPDDGGEAGGRGGRVRVVVLEGVVPGLDFCNHRVQANCWWEVVDAPSSSSNSSSTASAGASPSAAGLVVQLLTNRACCPAPGQELFISYGDKGNEELLMLYGFALAANPHDVVMVPCPLPLLEHGKLDDTTAARLELLAAQGLQPQIFLAASFLAEYQRLRSVAAARVAQPGAATFVSCLPPQARATLEAFVIEPPELARRLEAAAAAAADSGGDRGASGGAAGPLVDRLAMDMAVITTFVRLLELQLLQLEDEDEGTGPLERDVQLLAAGIQGADGAPMPQWRAECMVYRAGQKRLVREFVVAARGELQATMRALQHAVDEEREEAAAGM